jgi:hypothetical protein
MDLQDREATFHIRLVDYDLPVEAPWSQESGIQNVRPVRGGEHHDAFVAGKTVHLD